MDVTDIKLDHDIQVGDEIEATSDWRHRCDIQRVTSQEIAIN